MSWFAEAPANIALIKYMGKANARTNLPLNASLSYTLPKLITRVELEASTEQTDRWEPLNKLAFISHAFSEQAQTRFLKHLAFLKTYMGYSGTFIVRSANNFPHGTGLASSASSFAALTRATLKACSTANTPMPDIQTQAALSRQGSGSSCRSFFEPWAHWDGEHVQAITLPYPNLIHQVILIHQEEKKVSSSEAHRRVSVLPDYPARKIRAEQNLANLLDALKQQDWHQAYRICWDEFQDMHALFSASEPAFSYITEQTQQALKILTQAWDSNDDGPLITMDAGPNIHLLYRPEQAELAHAFKQHALEHHLHVL
jgi:diphosphomevalonate decarboxylase